MLNPTQSRLGKDRISLPGRVISVRIRNDLMQAFNLRFFLPLDGPGKQSDVMQRLRLALDGFNPPGIASQSGPIGLPIWVNVTVFSEADRLIAGLLVTEYRPRPIDL